MFAVETTPAYNLARSLPGLVFKAERLWRFYLGPTLSLPVLLLIFLLPKNTSWNRLGTRTRILLIAGAALLVAVALESIWVPYFRTPLVELILSLGLFRLRRAWSRIGRQTRFLLAVLGVFLVALALETFCEPHYASPIACLILALALLAMRHLQTWRWGRKRVGLFLVRAIPVICVLTFVLRLAAHPLHLPLSTSYVAAWDQRARGDFGRAGVLAKLERLPGRQLVIVRYSPDHDIFCEWVYNDADIDASKVVWARDMGYARNQELLRYFKDRQVFLLEADEHPPKLLAYWEANSSPIGTTAPMDQE